MHTQQYVRHRRARLDYSAFNSNARPQWQICSMQMQYAAKFILEVHTLPLYNIQPAHVHLLRLCVHSLLTAIAGGQQTTVGWNVSCFFSAYSPQETAHGSRNRSDHSRGSHSAGSVVCSHTYCVVNKHDNREHGMSFDE